METKFLKGADNSQYFIDFSLVRLHKIIMSPMKNLIFLLHFSVLQIACFSSLSAAGLINWDCDANSLNTSVERISITSKYVSELSSFDKRSAEGQRLKLRLKPVIQDSVFIEQCFN